MRKYPFSGPHGRGTERRAERGFPERDLRGNVSTPKTGLRGADENGMFEAEVMENLGHSLSDGWRFKPSLWPGASSDWHEVNPVAFLWFCFLILLRTK